MKHNCLAVLTDSLHWKKFFNEKFCKGNLNKKILIADKNNVKFEVRGTGKPLRQFIYSKDLAKLIMFIL